MTRIFKPDSGQTLEIQDEGGSAALTIDTDGDIQIANNINTGTFKGTIDSSATFPAGRIMASIDTLEASVETSSGTDHEALSVAYNMTDDSAKLIVMGIGYVQRGSADGTIRISITEDHNLKAYTASLACKDDDAIPVPSCYIAGYSGSKTWRLELRSDGSNKAILQAGSGLMFMEVKQ
jgi:hypothetical protein